MKEVERQFGKRVRELRLARGLSQEEMAFKIGVHRTYLGGIERGERNPSLRNIASTMVSQAIDNVIFCSIALWGLFDTNTWVQILATTYLLKLLVAVIDTPFIYLAKRLSPAVVAKESGITLQE